jgi:ankyrin repeat protein
MKHKEMLLFLLEQPGINIDQRNSEGRTTLHETVQMNDVGVAQTLLHHGGADLNKKDAVCLLSVDSKMHGYLLYHSFMSSARKHAPSLCHSFQGK